MQLSQAEKALPDFFNGLMRTFESSMNHLRQFWAPRAPKLTF